MGLLHRKLPQFERAVLQICKDAIPSGNWSVNESDDAVIGGVRRVNLTQLRLRWNQLEVGERTEWLEAVVRPLVQRRPDENPLDRDHVFAVIRSRALLETGRLTSLAQGFAPVPVPHLRLTEDLCGVLAMVSGSSITTVNETHLNAWGVSFKELWWSGIRNLSKLDHGEWMVMPENVHVSTVGDGFVNARLLIPHFLDQLEIDGPMALFMPHRNSLIVAPLGNENAVALGCSLALEEMTESGQISFLPVVFHERKFNALKLEPGHPAWAMWRELSTLDGRLNYDSTSADLRKMLGEDIFVADYLAHENGDGSLDSRTMWTEGQSLIPKVEWVVFYEEGDPPSAMTASWYDVITNCSDLMEPTTHYPPRFRLKGLPPRDLIRSISKPMEGSFPF